MKFQILGIILLLALVTAVSADVTCSFINITTGPQGVQGIPGINGTVGPAGPMNQTPNLTAGPQGIQGNTGATGAPGPNNDPWYLWINGTRAMTGNLSLGGYYINNLISGGLGSDAVNKSYVDTHASNYNASYWTGTNYNASYLTSTYNATYDAKTNYNASYWTGTNYNASYLTSTYNATYDAKSNYNNSYVEKSNTSYVLTSNATYVLTGGSRAMTGNLNLGSQQITSLITGTTGDTAVNKTYVDAGLPYVATGNGSLVLTNNNSYVRTSNTSYVLTQNTSYVLTNNASYVLTNNGSYILGGNTSYILVDGSRAMTGNLSLGSKYINNLITGGLGSDAVNKSYVDSTAGNYNASYINKDGSVAMTGNLSLGSKYINSLITGGLGSDAVNKSYVDTMDSQLSNYNNSYVTKDNTSYVQTSNLSYVLTNNSTYVKNPVFGYVTLMAGSAMVTTTNPVAMNQWETSSNKNNYISLNFTDGGTEVAQWIVDFPGDWNATGNVVFTTIWTTAEGGANTGVNWTIKGKLLGDDAALDTALATVGYSNDTWIAAGDVHVGTPSTGAAITAVGTGNTAIIAVNRDSASDDMAGTAQLLGLRIKYIRSLA